MRFWTLGKLTRYVRYWGEKRWLYTLKLVSHPCSNADRLESHETHEAELRPTQISGVHESQEFDQPIEDMNRMVIERAGNCVDNDVIRRPQVPMSSEVHFSRDRWYSSRHDTQWSTPLDKIFYLGTRHWSFEHVQFFNNPIFCPTAKDADQDWNTTFYLGCFQFEN